MNEVDLLITIIKEMVSNRDAVRVEQSQDEMGYLLTVFVDDSDKGFLIGKDGDTIRGLRTVFRRIGFNTGKRISIVVDDPNRSSAGFRYQPKERVSTRHFVRRSDKEEFSGI